MHYLMLFIQSALIQNILLFYFLGVCSYLACSNRIKTAHGLGLAVIVVMTTTGVLNWFVHHYITKPNALIEGVDLSFLELILYITVIAAFVQILEIIIDKYSPKLYNALGIFLPLITVNCAILGACLFVTVREYSFVENFFYMLGSGVGWWLAIILIASLRHKITYSEISPAFQGMGVTFMITGLMALAFMIFAGIQLDQQKETLPPLLQEVAGTSVDLGALGVDIVY